MEMNRRMVIPAGLRASLVMLAFLSVVLVRAEPHRITVRFAEISGLNPANTFGAKLSYLPEAEVDNEINLMVQAGVARVTKSKELTLLERAVTVAPSDPFDEVELLPDMTGGVEIIVGGNRHTFRTRKVGIEADLQLGAAEETDVSLKTTVRRTTFEGFVEYSGQQVNISSAADGKEVKTVVTVPSGFYQPIFSTDETVERLTIKPGLTTVLRMDWTGRDQQKSPDHVDLPVSGALFEGKNAYRPRVMLLFLGVAD